MDVASVREYKEKLRNVLRTWEEKDVDPSALIERVGEVPTTLFYYPTIEGDFEDYANRNVAIDILKDVISQAGKLRS